MTENDGRLTAQVEVSREYLQGTKKWDVQEDELPRDYVSRWESADGSRKRQGWGPEQGETANWEHTDPNEKYFTTLCFSYLPLDKMNHHQIEVMIRKHRIDDLTRRLIL